MRTKEKLSQLADRIEELEERTKYYEGNSSYSYYYASTLTASQIIQRFDELYKWLGIERKHIHEHDELVKKAK